MPFLWLWTACSEAGKRHFSAIVFNRWRKGLSHRQNVQECIGPFEWCWKKRDCSWLSTNPKWWSHWRVYWPWSSWSAKRRVQTWDWLPSWLWIPLIGVLAILPLTLKRWWFVWWLSWSPCWRRAGRKWEALLPKWFLQWSFGTRPSRYSGEICCLGTCRISWRSFRGKWGKPWNSEFKLRRNDF